METESRSSHRCVFRTAWRRCREPEWMSRAAHYIARPLRRTALSAFHVGVTAACSSRFTSLHPHRARSAPPAMRAAQSAFGENPDDLPFRGGLRRGHACRHRPHLRDRRSCESGRSRSGRLLQVKTAAVVRFPKGRSDSRTVSLSKTRSARASTRDGSTHAAKSAAASRHSETLFVIPVYSRTR